MADRAGTSRRSVRLFIAAPLPDTVAAEVRAVVAAVQREIDARATKPRSPVRWVRLDGLHVTLKFLGPTPAERIAEAGAAIERAVAGHDPFPVAVRGGGAFPSAARPRTLWLGIADRGGGLERLARAVDLQLAVDGWPPETRPYRAHLTLARADGRREGSVAAELLARRASDVDLPFAVDRVVLYESVTGKGPAAYVPLHETRLA